MAAAAGALWPTPRPSEFTYRRWSSGDRTVVAESVTFEPTGHVVFRDHLGRVVLAERQEQVNELKQTGAGVEESS